MSIVIDGKPYRFTIWGTAKRLLKVLPRRFVCYWKGHRMEVEDWARPGRSRICCIYCGWNTKPLAKRRLDDG